MTMQLTEIMKNAFVKGGFLPEFGQVTLSNRPDLCQFQCNGALAAAKIYKRSPYSIASDIVEQLKNHQAFREVSCVMPGFINLNLSDEFLIGTLLTLSTSQKFGCEPIQGERTILMDYGGPNVAKPLHVGHLRTAIIGESLKRIFRYHGVNVLADVHLGDWGLQIGMIITELNHRKPQLPYFNDTYTGLYPEEAPFNIMELEELYPKASIHAKNDPDYMEQAKQATYQFQNGHPGYVALWKHILEISVSDLKRNYANLNVSFDLWNKESDVQPRIPKMLTYLKDNGYAYLSDGAIVVDVLKESDTREMPPCILVKSDGATLYGTTDLATIVERVELFHPDEILYIVDKRQELHFQQVFRCAHKTGLAPLGTKLTYLGFGTMNGTDGKPFKTRNGGVMLLENLISEANGRIFERISANREIPEQEAQEISKKVGLAALKYSDLSNQIAKDYQFDVERFTASEGNTGPYIIYTAVRIHSLLEKYRKQNPDCQIETLDIQKATSISERDWMLQMTLYNEAMRAAFDDYAPHKVCQFIYDLANTFNRFYHENRILSEPDKNKQTSWLRLCVITHEMLETGLDLLGIELPERM